MPQDPIPFEPGFPGDWPVRPANSLQLDWRAHTRNFIHLWMPEGISTRSEPAAPLFILNEVADYRFSRPQEGLWVQEFTKPGVLSLRGECRDIANGVSLSLRVTNFSGRPWEGVIGGVCVQLAAAPDFTDPDRERTFGTADGKLIRMGEPRGFQGLTQHFSPATAPTENFICVESREPGFVLAQWWEGDGRFVGGNCHRSITCIHAPPDFGDIGPGQSVERTGRLYLMLGSAADALERYKDEG